MGVEDVVMTSCKDPAFTTTIKYYCYEAFSIALVTTSCTINPGSFLSK